MAPGWLTIIAATLAVALIPQTSSEHSRSPSLAHTRAPSLANSHAPSSDDHKYNIDDLITDDYEELLEYCYGDRYEQEDDNKVSPGTQGRFCKYTLPHPTFARVNNI